MQQVSALPPLPTSAAGFADVVVHDLLTAASPILASAAFWNAFAALAQQVPDPAQQHEFLDRLRTRLAAPSAPVKAGRPRFSGPTALKMLAGIRAARQPRAADAAPGATAQGPYAYLVWQVDLAAQMVRSDGRVR